MMSRRRRKKPLPKIQRTLNTHFMPYPHDHPHAETTEDGDEIHKFRFAFKRGELDARMSGLELCAFVIGHMRAVLAMRLLDYRADIEIAFAALYQKLTTDPRAVLDELLPWIRVEKGLDDNDYIYLNIHEKRPQAAGPTYFT
jgi:hypothetical protein